MRDRSERYSSSAPTRADLKRVHSDVAAKIAHHTSGEFRTAREIEVLSLAATGNSNKRIWIKLFIPWRPKRDARSTTIRMIASTVGALILARAVDDERLSDEILSVVRKDLA
jgi:hypothetical protein